MRPTTTIRLSRLVLTLSMCIVFRGLVRGQVLTPADVLAPEGVTYTSFGITDLIPWDTLQGPGVSWEYDWITVDSTSAISYTAIPLNEAPDAGEYPEADRVVRSLSGTNGDYIIDRFFELVPGRLIELGSVGPVLSYVYESPGLVYGMGMDLGDTLNGDYCYWSDGFGVQFHFCGEDHVTFDATGTLVLPYGTFTGVKHVTQWASIFETTGPSTDSSYSVRQQWFLQGVPFPVLEASIFIDEQGTWYPAGRLMDQASFTAVSEMPPQPGWSAGPNPTTGDIRLSDLPADALRIEVLTEDGRSAFRVDSGHLGTSAMISLSGMAEGVYLVRVVDPRGASTRRVVKLGH